MINSYFIVAVSSRQWPGRHKTANFIWIPMIPTKRSKETNKINATESIQQAKGGLNHMTDVCLRSKLSWWKCSSLLPEYVSVSQHPFEPLAVPHRSHFTNFSNSPPPVQKAIMKVYVVHVWKSLQSRTWGNKWKRMITAWEKTGQLTLDIYIKTKGCFYVFIHIISDWNIQRNVCSVNHYSHKSCWGKGIPSQIKQAATAQVLLKNTANIFDHNMITAVAWQQEGPGFEPQAKPFLWGVGVFVFFHLRLIPHSKDKQRPGQWLYTASRHKRESPIRVSPVMVRCVPWVSSTWCELRLTQVQTGSSVNAQV